MMAIEANDGTPFELEVYREDNHLYLIVRHAIHRYPYYLLIQNGKIDWTGSGMRLPEIRIAADRMVRNLAFV
jgi:hypothetical protein